MTVAIQATTPATFEIKSANLPLVALLLKSADLTALQRELTLRFGDVPDFFDQDALVIDLSFLPISVSHGTAVLDFRQLVGLLRTYRLNPIAVRGGDPAHMAAALGVGLLAAPDANLLGTKTDKLAKNTPTGVSTDQDTASAAAVGALAAVSVQPNALVIDKPLRSGQQVYARGRDLVVLAMVNAGAEVIADGHIHVYAPLRGKAIAGARGNTDARIFTLALDAELLSIAGIYRTSETPLPASMRGKPTQIRLVATAAGDKLMMEVMLG